MNLALLSRDSYVQVEAFENQFDATRSTGYLCAATVANFEKVRLACFGEEKKSDVSDN